MPIREVRVPHLGDFDEVPVVEVLVGPGDAVKTEEALVTLESDKATMDVPAPSDGVVKEISVGVGDSVSEGHLLLTIDSVEREPDTAAASALRSEAPEGESPEEEAPRSPSPAAAPAVTPGSPSPPPGSAAAPSAGPRELWPRSDAHATPSLRRFARGLGVNLAEVCGSGRKGRILEEDVKAFVKRRLEGPGDTPAAPAPPEDSEMPEIDFSRFGEIEVHPCPGSSESRGPTCAGPGTRCPT